MDVTKEMMMNEAVKRMYAMHIMPRVIEEFKSGVLNKSEGMGILYWLTDEEKEAVEEFEREYNGLVYHVVKTNTEFGTLLNMFYVSKYMEEWEMDREDIEDGYACVYVKNLTDEWCSEIGSICFKPVNGGLVRIG